MPKRHGACRHRSATRLYRIWNAMNARCYVKTNKDYGFYGGRGIGVCDEWRHDYVAFSEWAYSNGYDDNAERGKCTLDRINNDLNYCPENCRFTTMLEQSRNKRNTKFVTIFDVKMPFSVACERYNVPYHKAEDRMRKLKWSVEETFGLVKRYYRGKLVN